MFFIKIPLRVSSYIRPYISKYGRYGNFNCSYTPPCYYCTTSLKLSQDITDSLKDYINKLHSDYTELVKSQNYATNPKLVELGPLADILTARTDILANISSLKELINSEDADMSQLAKDERKELEGKLDNLDQVLIDKLVPDDREDSFQSIILEVTAGVGGQEAMLFAKEMFAMYCSFISNSNKGWQFEIIEYLTSEMGGLRHGSIQVEGHDVYKYLKYEGGVHRVQRVPATEKAGRVHTSTVSVTALPQPSEIDIKIDPKDLKIETKRSSGAGGQHVNTTDSAVRIVHLPTNIMVDCQIDRSQLKNRKLAMNKLRALLYQKELDSQMAEMVASKRSQVRSNNRNEKIRTYNFNQDRITDHRLKGVHYHNLQGFLENGQDLHELIEQLQSQTKIASLMEIVNKSCK